jgi:hypothetical protein
MGLFSPSLPCESCGSYRNVRPEGSRTKPRLTSWERLKLEEEGLTPVVNPNRTHWLCPPCSEKFSD